MATMTVIEHSGRLPGETAAQAREREAREAAERGERVVYKGALYWSHQLPAGVRPQDCAAADAWFRDNAKVDRAALEAEVAYCDAAIAGLNARRDELAAKLRGAG